MHFSSKVLVFGAVGLGVLLGLGLFTFIYAEGFSYFTTDPKACANCHMPYMREGALKVSDHWVRSPLTNVNRACQQCHHYPEQEILKRVETIQDRHYALLTRAGNALVDMLDAIKAAKAASATEAQLAPVLELQRQAQWRLDFVAAENSMGFHAPQELARILGESIDMSRQAQLAATSLKVTLAHAAPAGAR